MKQKVAIKESVKASSTEGSQLLGMTVDTTATTADLFIMVPNIEMTVDYISITVDLLVMVNVPTTADMDQVTVDIIEFIKSRF